MRRNVRTPQLTTLLSIGTAVLLSGCGGAEPYPQTQANSSTVSPQQLAPSAQAPLSSTSSVANVAVIDEPFHTDFVPNSPVDYSSNTPDLVATQPPEQVESFQGPSEPTANPGSASYAP